MSIKEEYNSIDEAIRKIYGFKSETKAFHAARQYTRIQFNKSFGISTEFWKEVREDKLEKFLLLDIQPYMFKRINAENRTKAINKINDVIRKNIEVSHPIKERNALIRDIYKNFYEEGATEKKQRLNYLHFVQTYELVFNNDDEKPTYEEWINFPVRVYDCIQDSKSQSDSYDVLDTTEFFFPKQSEVNEIAIKSIAKLLGVNIDFDGIKKALEAQKEINNYDLEEIPIEIDYSVPLPEKVQEKLVEHNKKLSELTLRLDKLDFATQGQQPNHPAS